MYVLVGVAGFQDVLEDFVSTDHGRHRRDDDVAVAVAVAVAVRRQTLDRRRRRRRRQRSDIRENGDASFLSAQR